MNRLSSNGVLYSPLYAQQRGTHTAHTEASHDELREVMLEIQ